MNKRTGNIIISLLVLIIIVSGVYIAKTLLMDDSAATQNDRAQVTVMAEPTAEAAEPTAAAPKADTSSESAAMRQASENDPARAKEVSRPALSQQILTQAKIIVLDPGHGKSSSLMSAEEKAAEGYVQNSNGNWGEWRHWKSGTSNEPCYASGCTGRAPSGASCWYPMGNGDRSTEPEINLNNTLNAKKYLEQMGYTVRMTRTSNDQNPSFSRRISYCYPSNDNTQNADAEVYVCIHSNAGGGRGSAYISAGGLYDQKMKNGANSTYADSCNTLGRMINERIVSETSLSQSGGGSIGGEEALIAFCKSPVPVGYVEIGFFDNSSDLSILRSETDSIGRAIAEGVDDYLNSR